ncbi:7206_t:CDS:1, partial [Cetraspora pellucida]
SDYTIKNPTHIGFLNIYKTYSEYEKAKFSLYKIPKTTILLNFNEVLLYDEYINKINIDEKDKYIREKFLKLKDCDIPKFLIHEDFYKRYSFLSNEEKNIYYSEFQKHHDRILI